MQRHFFRQFSGFAIILVFSTAFASLSGSLAIAAGTARPAAAKSVEALPEISDEEYRVFSHFFAMGNSGKPQPEHLYDMVKSRAVSRYTGSKVVLDEKWRQQLHQKFGEIETGLIEDYRAKNVRPALVRDKIAVRYMTIVAEEVRMLPELAQGKMRPLNLPGINSSIVRLSRVGFDARKETALFHVDLTGGGPSIGHFILMTKSGEQWLLKGMLMTRYIIH